MNQKNRSVWIKFGIFCAFLFLIYGIFRLFRIDYHQFTPQRVRGFLLGFGAWAPIVYIVFYVIRPLVLFPAGILSITGGLAFGSLFGTLYTVIGATLCALWEFLFARAFGREAVGKFIKGKITRLDEGIEKHGFMTVLWVRLIPSVAYDMQNYGLGLTKVRLKDYFWATLFGIIPGTFAFVYLGSSLTDLKNFWKFLAAVLLVAALSFLPKVWKKRPDKV
ncbi:MAG: TVP38/TMEM64 family protein [Candidatus Omnitrophica bacterium]|nr:TVP38/TMEM64 family protein [Candidatus Omnitrophota bacterium]